MRMLLKRMRVTRTRQVLPRLRLPPMPLQPPPRGLAHQQALVEPQGVVQALAGAVEPLVGLRAVEEQVVALVVEPEGRNARLA